MEWLSGSVAYWVLKRPAISGVLVIVLGLAMGIVCQLFFGHNLFERFGSLTVAFGIIIFGNVNNLLQVRALGSFIMDDDGEPPEPFKSQTIKRALNWQAGAVVVGTMQWGFGSLIWSSYNV